MQKMLIQWVSTLLCCLACCQTTTQYKVLESFTSNDFTSSEGWTTNKQPITTNCGGKKIFGGFNIFSQTSIHKSINSLPEHVGIRFQASFYKLDSWLNEWFYIYADNIKVYSAKFDTSGTDICGGMGYNNQDIIVNIDITFSHTSSLLELRLQDGLDEAPDNESWGIRDIKVFVIIQCPSICDACETVYF